MAGFATLTVDMNMKIAEFEQQLDKAVATSKRSSKLIEDSFHGLRELAGFIGVSLGVHAFVESIKSVVDATIELGKASEKTGIAIEALSGLKAAAQDVELPFDELTALLAKFSKAIDNGSPAFARLGFSLADIQRFSKDPAQALGEVADKFNKMAAGAGKAAISMELFGKAGVAAIPFLNQGSKGFGEAAASAKSFGDVVTKESLAAMLAFDDQLDRVGHALAGIKQSLVDGLVPALTVLAKAFADSTQESEGFKREASGIGEVFRVVSVLGVNFAYVFRQIGVELAYSAEQIKQLVTGNLEEARRLGAEYRKQAEQARSDIDALSEKILHPPKAPPLPEAGKKQPGAKPAGEGDAALAKAKLDAIIAAEKLTAQQSLILLDDYHARGLVSERDYYEGRTKVVRDGLAEDIKAVNATIKAQKEANSQELDPTKQSAGEGKIVALLSQRTLLQRQFNFEVVKGQLEQEKGDQKIQDQVTELQATLIELDGELGVAAALRFDIANRLTKSTLDSNLKNQTEGLVAELKTRVVAQGELNKLTREKGILDEQLSTREIQIGTQLSRAGNSPQSQLEFQHAINEARLASLPALQAITAAQLEQARAANNTEAVAQLERQQAAYEAVAADATGAAAATKDFAVVQQNAALARADEATTEAHIQNLRARGQVSEVQALHLSDEARKGLIEKLKEQLVIQEKLAEESKDPGALLVVRQLKTEIESLNAAADSAAEKFRGALTDDLVSPLTDVITGVKSAKDAFADFGRSVEQTLARIASQRIAEQIFGASGAASGAGGFLANLFGAGAGAAAGGGGGGFSSEQGNIMTARGPVALQRYAAGGVTRGTKVSLFGEGSTPEAYVPLADGRSIPVTVKGGGGGTVVHMTVVTRDAESFRRSSGQVIGEINTRLAVSRARA